MLQEQEIVKSEGLDFPPVQTVRVEVLALAERRHLVCVLLLLLPSLGGAAQVRARDGAEPGVGRWQTQRAPGPGRQTTGAAVRHRLAAKHVTHAVSAVQNTFRHPRFFILKKNPHPLRSILWSPSRSSVGRALDSR